MATKRPSVETSLDEQATGSDSVSPQEDDAKRAKVDFASETMLDDLPIELLDYILHKVVVQEVRDAKLAKNAWKSKADAVMDRLKTVCSCWSHILTNDFFRNNVHRVLDGTAQKPGRMESLQHSFLTLSLLHLTTLKDEMFVLREGTNLYDGYSMYVYHRNNMEEPTDVIPLPVGTPTRLASCNVSNCVYYLRREIWFQASVLRITRDDNNQFTISPLLSDLWLPNPTLSVATNGSVILSKHRGTERAAISIYDANGSLQREVSVSNEISSIKRIIPKANGNLLLVSQEERQLQVKLTEVDQNGSILRQYLPSIVCEKIHVCQADIHGRVLVIEKQFSDNNRNYVSRAVLLDSELNILDFTGSYKYAYIKQFPFTLCYNSDRNEIVSMCGLRSFDMIYMSICRLEDEQTPAKV